MPPPLQQEVVCESPTGLQSPESTEAAYDAAHPGVGPGRDASPKRRRESYREDRGFKEQVVLFLLRSHLFLLLILLFTFSFCRPLAPTL
jgi:hypothetical protein